MAKLLTPHLKEINMTKIYPMLKLLVLLCLTLGVSNAVHAQATRTWVSGVGDDVNPCSRTAPCKTFAGAISKTAMNGEINALDPGGYGTLTITKSITVDGAGTMASSLAALTTGFIINITNVADTRKTVVLRNISINGVTTGIHGINFLAGLKVYVENVQIKGFQSSASSRAIKANVSAASQLYVKDTVISNCASGIDVSSTSGIILATIDNTRFEGMTDGFIIGAGSGGTLRNCVIVGNTGVGVRLSGSAGLSIESSLINSNGTGIQPGAGTTTDLSNTSIIGNTLGIATTGGSVQSHGNNQINLNVTPGATPTAVGQQ
jgi:hypothetical protein